MYYLPPVSTKIILSQVYIWTELAQIIQFLPEFLEIVDGVLKVSKSSHQDEFTWCHYENFGLGQKRE